ncbi:hypothetical protein [Mesorhizobium sp.]|uniref:hypothetical protein n=1 Tax=Mesorhizobium sp. TaxID=1871066 RepID=UPI000FE5DB2E|nr:hypothetical protein [Mesorhizobium sp.]RWE86944.1 MAG: hypothetical protein EOS49_11820 [Mesorhizobium sp.]
MIWRGVTSINLAIVDAGWPADALAKALKTGLIQVQAYLDQGTPLPKDTNENLQIWLGHHTGRGHDGLMYIDPYRPPQSMAGIVDHRVVGAR